MELPRVGGGVPILGGKGGEGVWGVRERGAGLRGMGERRRVGIKRETKRREGDGGELGGGDRETKRAKVIQRHLLSQKKKKYNKTMAPFALTLRLNHLYIHALIMTDSFLSPKFPN